MGFAVVVDSTCDLTQEEYKALDVHMVPLSVLIDGGNLQRPGRNYR